MILFLQKQTFWRGFSFDGRLFAEYSDPTKPTSRRRAKRPRYRAENPKVLAEEDTSGFAYSHVALRGDLELELTTYSPSAARL